MKKLNVLFAAFEAAPFIKTGGLGDVAAALPAAVSCGDVEVRAVLPKLAQIPSQYSQKMKFVTSFSVPLGWRNQYCGLFELELGGTVWYFLDNEYYFRREKAYGYYDDGERMAFFSKAVCECCMHLPGFFPDVLHCNDWHTGAAPVFLREQYRHIPEYAEMKVVFTIHNLKFQGIYDQHLLGDVLGLHECEAARNQLIRNQAVNYLAGACSYADRITTVSPTYAGEICTWEYGEGLQDIFLRRKNAVSGILNGINTADYNPATDPALTKCYSTPAGKAASKAALQKELGLEVRPDTPLLVVVSRLTEQKGFDLLNYILDELLQEDVQVAVLGTGDSHYEDHYKYLDWTRSDRFRARICFSEALSRQMYAGGDIFLMPSRFEPCGLSQMIAMRYGAIPVVRRTGGLADSVIPYDHSTHRGTGFVFNDFNAHAFLDSIREACGLYRDYKAEWTELQEQAMAADFSWAASAARYRELYHGLFA